MAVTVSDSLSLGNSYLPDGVRYAFTPARPAAGMLRAMPTALQQSVARRLRALMAELGMNRRQMADFMGASESKLGNWLGNGAKSNKPAEEDLVRLCEKVPGLTLDYLYRGVLDHVPMAMAIRLKAWEEGVEPDSPSSAPR